MRFRRSGGIFSGNRLALELDEGDLSADEGAALAPVASPDALRRVAAEPGTGMGADEYQYDIEIGRGDDVAAVRFDESRVPPELAPLVALLEARAERQARRPPAA